MCSNCWSIIPRLKNTFKKHLVINEKIGDKVGVGVSYLNLGKLYREFQLNMKSKEFANNQQHCFECIFELFLKTVFKKNF